MKPWMQHGGSACDERARRRMKMMKMMMRGGRGPWGGFGRGFGAGFPGDERGAAFAGGFGEDFGGEHRHGRRGRGRMFAGGELRLLLLGLVAEADRHGYELIREIEQLAGGAYAPSPGVVYPTLSLLVDEGMIAEAPGEGTRKAFTVTDAGRAEIESRRAELDAILARLRTFGEKRERTDSPPVRRAVANLMTVLGQRAMAGGLDGDAAHQVADILDDAAKRIERL